MLNADRRPRTLILRCAAACCVVLLAGGALLPAADAAEAVVVKGAAAPLIAKLGAPSFEEREAAEKELTGLGDAVLPELRAAAAESEDAEVLARSCRIEQRVLFLQQMARAVEQFGSDPARLEAAGRTALNENRRADAAQLFRIAAEAHRQNAARADTGSTGNIEFAQRKAAALELRAQSLEDGGNGSGLRQVQIQMRAGGGRRIMIRGGDAEIFELLEGGVIKW